MNARRIFAALVVSFAAVFAVVRVTGQDGSDFTRPSSGGVPTSRTIGTSAPLQGGGDLSSNRTISIAAQNSNVVLAGPTSGSAATPTFRPLVLADIPDLTSLYQAAGGGSSGANFFYGDGSDGALTYDGTTTVLGVVPSSNIYTLNANVFASSITVNSGVTVKAANNVVLCTGTLTLNGNINDDGASAFLDAAGNGVVGALGFNVGGTGGGVTAGSAGSATSGGTFGGGGGGAGGNSGLAGANGNGTGSPTGVAKLILRTGEFWSLAAFLSNTTTGFYSTTDSRLISTFSSLIGNGGGNGSGDGTNKGGGGGACAGLLVVRAKTITVGASGVFSASGGNGGNGTGNSYGGGGGGGGVLVTQAGTYSGTALVGGSNALVNGGTGGTGAGTGKNGGNGNNGTYYKFTNN